MISYNQFRFFGQNGYSEKSLLSPLTTHMNPLADRRRKRPRCRLTAGEILTFAYTERMHYRG
jgi:hypothetical protein